MSHGTVDDVDKTVTRDSAWFTWQKGGFHFRLGLSLSIHCFVLGLPLISPPFLLRICLISKTSMTNYLSSLEPPKRSARSARPLHPNLLLPNDARQSKLSPVLLSLNSGLHTCDLLACHLNRKMSQKVRRTNLRRHIPWKGSMSMKRTDRGNCLRCFVPRDIFDLQPHIG